MNCKELPFSVSKHCTGCGMCIRECLRDVFVLKNGRPVLAPGGEERCIHCAHCVMACPAAALSVGGIKPEDCEPAGPHADFNDLLRQLKNRRSIRHYRAENVRKEDLEEILTALRYSPTGVNYRSLHFSLIDDAEVMNRFRDSFYEKFFETQKNNPEAAASVSEWKDARVRGDDPVFRSAPHLLFASYDKNAPCGATDAVIALTHFELLANAKGIGTVWFGRIMNILGRFMPGYTKELRVPAGYLPGYAMLFGYADTKFYRTVNREIPGITRIF